MEKAHSTALSRSPAAGYQFIHISTAATKRVKKDTGRTYLRTGGHVYRAVGWSAQDLLQEALRFPGACPHVAAPSSPAIVYAANETIGANPITVIELAYAWADSRKAVTGRKHQLNSPILASGVISLPRDLQHAWLAFREKSLAFLKEKYGARLRLVVDHQDEGHPHCHYIVIPLFGRDDEGTIYSEDFGAVHPGIAKKKQAYDERQALVGKTGTNKQGRRYVKGASTKAAFIDGMKQFQDEFYQKVAVHFHLSRVGPRKQRLFYADAKRAEAEKLAEADLLVARRMKQQAEAEIARVIKMAWASESRARQAVEETMHAAAAEAEQIVQEKKQEAQRTAEQIRKEAEMLSAEVKSSIKKLLSGDEKAALKILQEKLELEEAKAALLGLVESKERQLIYLENAVSKLAKDLESAKNWVSSMVSHLEQNHDFTFSHVLNSGKSLTFDDRRPNKSK